MMAYVSCPKFVVEYYQKHEVRCNVWIAIFLFVVVISMIVGAAELKSKWIAPMKSVINSDSDCSYTGYGSQVDREIVSKFCPDYCLDHNGCWVSTYGYWKNNWGSALTCDEYDDSYNTETLSDSDVVCIGSVYQVLSPYLIYCWDINSKFESFYHSEVVRIDVGLGFMIFFAVTASLCLIAHVYYAFWKGKAEGTAGGIQQEVLSPVASGVSNTPASGVTNATLA
jgi:hypothetical protein